MFNMVIPGLGVRLLRMIHRGGYPREKKSERKRTRKGMLIYFFPTENYRVSIRFNPNFAQAESHSVTVLSHDGPVWINLLVFIFSRGVSLATVYLPGIHPPGSWSASAEQSRGSLHCYSKLRGSQPQTFRLGRAGIRNVSSLWNPWKRHISNAFWEETLSWTHTVWTVEYTSGYHW